MDKLLEKPKEEEIGKVVNFLVENIYELDKIKDDEERQNVFRDKLREAINMSLFGYEVSIIVMHEIKNRIFDDVDNCTKRIFNSI